MPIVELVLFLVWVNFVPFLIHVLLGDRAAAPLDGGLRWRDGRDLLGPNKTWRGVVAGVLAGAAAGPLVGVGWQIGALAALLAMVGDLLTSFVKRRLDRESGAAMFGLDQGLETLLPALLLAPAMGLGLLEVAIALLAAIPLMHLGSRYWHQLLARPPSDNYPRVVRSTTRLREWRACHVPLAYWQRWLNFENYFYYRVLMTGVFKAAGWYDRGTENVLAVCVRTHAVEFEDLPPAFDGYRVLLLTDLHLDGLPGLTDALVAHVAEHPVDLCLVGGDIRMEMYGPMAPALRELRHLLGHVQATDGIYGVLGNHDCIEMLPEFEAAGISMLINDAQAIRRGGEDLWLVGVDDPHYYKCHDLELAFRSVPPEAFKLFLAHSPEVFREAADKGAHLYLCGHTHGGQICLPVIGPVFTHSRAPRYTAAGPWKYGNMLGYTSSGAGASGIPLRFNCQGEISLIELRRTPAARAEAEMKPRVQVGERA
ncbi:CDP-archaeol synthase [Thioalkalivibrio sp.]|uniref:CDP-archaeol synthase n=1 Tax=Thioalkalivibrio sp. TaxID=2093813 RepID=UPI003567858B